MFNNYSFSAAIVLRRNYVNKAGECGLYLRIIIDRKPKYYSLNRFIRPVCWNKATSQVNNKHNDCLELNLFLNNEKTKANEIHLELIRKDKPFSHAIFEGQYFNMKIDNDFYSFGKSFIATLKGKYTAGTIKHYETELSKLKKHKSSVRMSDINIKFLSDYEYYMRNAPINNCTNTVHKTFKYLKVIIKAAINQGLMQHNPFTNYKIRLEPVKREYLSYEELTTLENKLFEAKLSDKLLNTLRPFLFACYTGLRYQDMYDLTKKDIRTAGNSMYVSIMQHKTKEQVMIPLTSKAIKLIENIDTTSLFNLYSNQKCNEYLKLICVAANIDKKVSFHTARHTFATLSLNLGIPLDVVSKLLGHNEIKTTQIYAKMMDKTKFTHMQKWENV